MKKTALVILISCTTFFLGYAFRSVTGKYLNNYEPVGRATGIGGIFFKCKDPGKVREWYKTHLGFQTNKYGAVFEWRQGADSSQKGFTQWSPFGEKTTYFAPSEKDFMINYRVENLEALLAKLKTNGVVVTDSMQVYDYGKFAHIIDIEGNKVELWEPNDEVYEQLGRKMGSKTIK